MTSGGPVLPRYGEASLADVCPALLAAVGVAGCADPFAFEPARSAVLLLVDGLGQRQLAEHANDAPFLSALAAAGATLTTCFPSTTVTSVASLFTGVPPGRHGLVGYSMATPAGVLNLLRWQLGGDDARQRLVPEDVQPQPTVFERVAATGALTTLVVPGSFEGSGLTRAALRGGRIHPATALGDVVAGAVTAAAQPGSFTYAYHGDLDLLGHLHGPGSLPWRMQLRVVDRLVEALADALPPGTLLAVTGDHGMVRVVDRVDVEATPGFADGVTALAGEPRCRYVYTAPGALGDVLAAWGETLGDRAWVLPGERTISDGWYGPTVDDAVRARIGDVVVAARDGAALVRPRAEHTETPLAGHHGSLTADEALVPLLTHRA